MCGRFTLHESFATLRKRLRLIGSLFEPPARYNIAPTQTVLAVRLDAAGRMGTGMHWGLIPSWAKDAKIGNRMINARAETVAEKPAFRAAFKRRRCILPASGFYEWRKDPDGKTPMYITLRDGGPLCFAGLWESWTDQDSGQDIESCTILTTTPNELMSKIHNRMPVILRSEDEDAWLDVEGTPADRLQSLLVPFDADAMQAHPVSRRVNSPSNDEAGLIEPVATSLFGDAE